MKLLIFLLAMVVAMPAGAQQAETRNCAAIPAEHTGRFTVIDGDTIAVTGLKPHVRLWGIQAPEVRDRSSGVETVGGMRARVALAELSGLTVRCAVAKRDRYCRAVARCTLPNTPEGKEGVDLSEMMLREGLAYGYYLDEEFPGLPELGATYLRREEFARENRMGMWHRWLGEAEPARRR